MKTTKYIKLNENFSKGEVFTPIELVKNILLKIPKEIFINKNSSFLVPSIKEGNFVIELVRMLVEDYGFSVENAKSRVIGIDNRLKFVNNLKIKGYNVYHADFLKEKLNMKFDVIVGNPPYQSGKGEAGGRTALWRYFVKNSFNLLKENGILSFVCPQLPNSSNDLGDIFTNNQTLWVNTDVAKYFKGVGSSFVCWAVQNAPKTKNTKFTFENIDLDITRDILPNKLSEIGISIINKIKNCKEIKILFSNGVNHNKLKEITETQSPIKTETHIYKLRRTIGDTTFCYTSILPDEYTKNKISFTKSGAPNFMYHNGSIDPIGSIKHMSGTILCDTEDVSNNMIWVFSNSKLSKFYNIMIKTGGMTGFDFIRPDIDYSNKLNDSDVYKYYNLTQEEINFVEANVK